MIDISVSLRQLVACFDDVRFASSAPARGSKHGEQLAVSLCAFNPEGFGFFFQGTSTTFFFKKTFGTQWCVRRALRSTVFIWIEGNVGFHLCAFIDATAALATSAC